MSAADAEVLADLRRARRRHRVADIHWVDAMYRVYVTAILATAAVLVLSGLTGDGKLDAAGTAKVLEHGPAALGLVAAAAVLVGLRSGCRGGPLALEKPDVRHVLLSPIDRGVALRSPTLHQLRFLTFGAVVAGAIAGQLAVRRLDGNPIVWVLCASLFCVLLVWLSIGCAMLASGRRLRSWIGTSVGLALVAWSVADLAGRAPTAPLSFLGRLALWPLRFDALALIPAAVAVAAMVLGVGAVSGLSLEAAERRTALVGQIKFAATLQDLRTVLVLRRQLSNEVSRTKPWLGHPARTERAHPTRFPVWWRGWRGVMRWPSARLARLVLLAVVAGLAMRGAWDGTTPLIVVGGFALWVAALDAIEPLAQETDHPGRLEAYPLDRGKVLLSHVPVTLCAMVLVTVVAGAAAVLASPSTGALRVAAIAIIPAAGGAAAGAVVSVLMGAPKPSDNLAMISPEVAGMRNLLRTVGPPLLGVVGVAPVLAARVALNHQADATSAQLAASLGVLVAVAVTFGWVRFRDDVRAWFEQAMEEAKATQRSKGGGAGSGAGRSTASASAPTTVEVDEDEDGDEDWDEDDEWDEDEDDEWDDDEDETEEPEPDEPDDLAPLPPTRGRRRDQRR